MVPKTKVRLREPACRQAGAGGFDIADFRGFAFVLVQSVRAAKGNKSALFLPNKIISVYPFYPFHPRSIHPKKIILKFASALV
jgi:hypothetical protein